MVQVDVFWSYGIGASLAVAAARQLRYRSSGGPSSEHSSPTDPEGAETEAARAPERGESPRHVDAPRHAHAARRRSLLENRHFAVTALYLALLFAPSGAYLLWNFTSWETMHAGGKDMPAWLVAAFSFTNVSQGLLAFWVVDRLLARSRTYLAYLQVVVPYIAMFFVLVHGWDGRGYQRFFSATREDFLAWDGDWTSWLTSEVAVTLYVMGAVLIPVLIGLSVAWLQKGYRLAGGQLEGRRTLGRAGLVAISLATPLVAGLGLALVASLLVMNLGLLAGIPAALAAVALALVPRGPVHRLFELYRLDDGPHPVRRPVPSGRPSARTLAGGS